jgi:hypothetical protein
MAFEGSAETMDRDAQATLNLAFDSLFEVPNRIKQSPSLCPQEVGGGQWFIAATCVEYLRGVALDGL